jgi:nucleoside-diphosphate-sugar epimerase
MRVVVTGASGNVGTALLSELRAAGGFDVVAVSRRRPPPVPPYDTAEWHSIDVGSADARERLRRVFTGADAVVHLAWLVQPSHDREVTRRANQSGTAAVAHAAVEAGVGHLLHQSSIGAYAPGHGRTVDETWPTTGIPSSDYSVDKSAAERIVDEVADRITVSITRPAIIFQPAAASEVKRYFIGRAVPHAALRRRVLRVLPLPRVVSFQAVHADDVAAALRMILERRAEGPYNVAAPPVLDRAALAEVFGGIGPPLPFGAIRAVTAATWRARLQPTGPGWLDMAAQAPTLDTTRLQTLGWHPTRDGREVLARFVDALGRGEGHPGPLLYPARTG